jgi:hypothetical protein
MKNKHTPGPWQVGNFEPKAIFDCNPEGPQRVANTLNNLADARLIAAAPELLEALKDMRMVFDNGSNEIHAALEVKNDAVRKCRAAIAKATGAA